MKKIILAVLVTMLAVGYTGAANAVGPTKDIVQPAQGMMVAQERCAKYAGDEEREAACVLFHAGAVAKTPDGQYVLNVALTRPVQVDPNRRTGQVVKCPAEGKVLSNGQIVFVETGKNCYRE